MQAYGEGFARVYNVRWASFARQAAPYIFEHYRRTRVGQATSTLLDLCCGTGQLALYFLERDFRVTGLDLSTAVLEFARENAADFIGRGAAHFERCDVTRFSMADHFGLVTATYDALNHLESFEALKSCFRSVFAVLLDGGTFIFDLNTRLGLLRWNNINIEENDEALIVTRGLYDGRSERAWTRVSGCVRVGGGLYQRFEETVFNTVYDLAAVERALNDIGWANVHFARLQELSTPLDAPEREGRVFVVAQK
jgi:SAM-dependent methyltransferase